MTDAPWDRYVQGDHAAISDAAKRGAVLFYEGDRCSSCHEGDLFSDFQNYNIGVPQIGPGTGRSSPGDPNYAGLTNWDFGLEEITTNREDRFKFRTAPLRGVALTSPYMHNGAYAKLEDAIRHHVDPAPPYAAYDLTQIEARHAGVRPQPRRSAVRLQQPGRPRARAGQQRIDLTDAEIVDVIEFLKTLTDPAHARHRVARTADRPERAAGRRGRTAPLPDLSVTRRRRVLLAALALLLAHAAARPAGRALLRAARSSRPAAFPPT